MKNYVYELINLHDPKHASAIYELMNYYRLDKMGCETPLNTSLFNQIIEGLKKQCNYLGLLISEDRNQIALANCFINYSTFKAKPLLNIHDFIVAPNYRGMGAGRYLLQSIQTEAQRRGCCKMNLEVRHDNLIAQRLYQSEGFEECQPPMYFWQKTL